MSFVAFYSFLSYALIAAVTPGPNNILALSSAAAHGLRRSVPLLAGISAAGASIVTINQSTPENGAALVAVTIRTDTMQMSPEELTEKLSRQRMVVGVRCGYNL